MATAATGFFTRLAVDGLSATVEALYPVNDYGAPDFRTTDMVDRTLAYWSDLPRRQRRLLMALYALVELAAIVLVFGFRRFSRLRVSRREEVVRGFRASRLLPLRLIGDALKASTTVIYMSHPAVLAYVGMRTPCERPSDPLKVVVDHGVLVKMGEAS
jgi:hypothetical protein